MKLKLFLLPILFFVLASSANAQKFALKTNLIDDALLDINVGAEIGVAPKWTIDVPFSFNAWTLSHDRRWKHWIVQPGARYWLCDRFSGHFFGAHLHGGQYNLGGFNGKINLFGTDMRKLKESRYQGWLVGGGISYGYALVLSKHWNLEGEIGIGYAYTRYDRFRCTGCGKKVETNVPHNYFGLTKTAINITYLF